jgi:hypothetical protein
MRINTFVIVENQSSGHKEKFYSSPSRQVRYAARICEKAKKEKKVFAVAYVTSERKKIRRQIV